MDFRGIYSQGLKNMHITDLDFRGTVTQTKGTKGIVRQKTKDQQNSNFYEIYCLKTRKRRFLKKNIYFQGPRKWMF